MSRFWTVVNGTVGTAYETEDGCETSFLPMDHTEFRNRLVVVYPPIGQMQEVVPLTLEPTRSEKQILKVDHPCPGQQSVRNIFYAQYRGVEISAATNSFAEWYDPEAKEKARREAEAERIKWELEWEEKRAFLSSISDEVIFLHVIRSEIDKLRAGTLTMERIVDRVFSWLFERRFGAQSRGWWMYFPRMDCDNLERLKTNLFHYHDRQRAERKQRWLNQQKKTQQL